MAALARLARAVVELSQGAPQRFDLPFVGELLAFGHLNQLQHFLHLIHRALQSFDDIHHLINCLADGGAAMGGLGLGDPLGQLLDALQQGTGLGGATGRGRWLGFGFGGNCCLLGRFRR